MSDCISRQATIERIHRLYPSPPFLRMNRKRWEKEYKPYIEVEKEIEKLPSAQAERKRGRWEMKPDPYGFFDKIPVCSECGCTTKMRETYKFCPNCGADMRGEQVK